MYRRIDGSRQAGRRHVLDNTRDPELTLIAGVLLYRSGAKVFVRPRAASVDPQRRASSKFLGDHELDAVIALFSGHAQLVFVADFTVDVPDH